MGVFDVGFINRKQLSIGSFRSILSVCVSML